MNTIKARGYILTSEDIFARLYEPYTDHVQAYYNYINACPECGQPASNHSGDKSHCACGMSW